MPNLSESSMIVFVLAQVVSLFLMNNRIVTEAREEQRKLSVDKGILESMNRLKTEFLQDISHEMKNPLTLIASGINFADSRFDVSSRTELKKLLH